MHKLKHLMKEAATNKPDKLAELLMEEIKEVNANFMYELDVLVNGEYMDWCLKCGHVNNCYSQWR